MRLEVVSSLGERVSTGLLPYVRQPAQYIGGEVNQLVGDGDWERAEVRVAIAFPDTYSIGISHLGGQILYWLCNHTPGVVAERVYCPWLDAERRMRAGGISLFTWDTRQPVAEADILGISLQYEMTYSNVLTLLDLAGIPLRASQRDDSHPLVLGGGPQADNPEPVAEFFDLIVNGDGEDAMSGILAVYRRLKRERTPRREIIRTLAKEFRWLYAPSLYTVRYHDDGPLSSDRRNVGQGLTGGRSVRGGTVAAIEPAESGLPLPVERCQTPDFESASVPIRPLVPHVQAVHERIAIEIMRGCPQRCRFCHAGYTKRPLRWRSVDRILDIAERACAATGLEEIGLLSLSTADYPRLAELARRVEERFSRRRVSISVPSLRVDKMLQHVPWMVRGVRKSGLTIAVEAARDRLRRAILKNVTDGDLLDGVRAAFEAGWRSVKLYFLAGFPGERPEDIDAVWELSREVSEVRRQVTGRPARVNVSVNWLVPKPHTPMQWAAQPGEEYFRSVRNRLRSLSRHRSAVKIKMPRIDRSILEAAFARGDRRLADVIETAWRCGARFDGWDECFRPDAWDRAFERHGLDKAWYAHRERDADEVFPWSHLVGARQGHAYLRRQYEELVALQTREPESAPDESGGSGQVA